MKLARYWSRDFLESGGIRVHVRGWSNESLEAAHARAGENARRLAERLAGRGFGNKDGGHGYEYGDRPLPEPVLRTFPAAAVTRNSYGALVLNTDRMMFVDIDRQEKPRLFTFLRKPPEDGIRRVAERYGFSARIYQTAAGHRAIITGQTFQAGSAEAESILKDFGSDPMYVRLCRLQESFRARLTPKPWRCGLGNPPVQFPFATSEDEAKFQVWEADYSRRSCRWRRKRVPKWRRSGALAVEPF